MTVRLFLVFTFLCATLGYAADSVTPDLDGLRAMTTWNITQPNWPIVPDQSCSIRDPDHYERSRLDHEIGSDIEEKRATHQVALLDQKVTLYLKQHHWAAMDVGQNGREIPNVKRCYQKQGVIVQIYQTTGRCTMNSPCTAYDGFAITIYLPKTK